MPLSRRLLVLVALILVSGVVAVRGFMKSDPLRVDRLVSGPFARPAEEVDRTLGIRRRPLTVGLGQPAAGTGTPG